MIIGTSAGSVVGADIACGQEPEALYRAQLAPPDPEPAARIGWGVIGRLLWVMGTSRDPVRARARIGRWALAARTMPESGRREVFQARLPASEWPAMMLKVTAVDARTGEFVVFDSAGEAGLVDAVGASCAVPGVWPPVTIGNRRFMDGGVRSVANADLAASYQRVVIVAPVAQGTGPLMPGPGRQAAALAAAGARVALVRPDRAAMRAIGRNVLDVSRRAAAATAGRAQTAAEAAAVRTVWQADGRPAFPPSRQARCTARPFPGCRICQLTSGMWIRSFQSNPGGPSAPCDLLDGLGFGGAHALPFLLVCFRDLARESKDEVPVIVEFPGRCLAPEQCHRVAEVLQSVLPSSAAE